MKLRRDLEPEDLETLIEIEEELRDREPSLYLLTLLLFLLEFLNLQVLDL